MVQYTEIKLGIERIFGYADKFSQNATAKACNNPSFPRMLTISNQLAQKLVSRQTRIKTNAETALKAIVQQTRSRLGGDGETLKQSVALCKTDTITMQDCESDTLKAVLDINGGTGSKYSVCYVECKRHCKRYAATLQSLGLPEPTLSDIDPSFDLLSVAFSILMITQIFHQTNGSEIERATKMLLVLKVLTATEVALIPNSLYKLMQACNTGVPSRSISEVDVD